MAQRRWRQSRDDCDSQKSKVLSKLYIGLEDAYDMIPMRKGDCAEPLRRPEGETWQHGNTWQPISAIKTAFLECGSHAGRNSAEGELSIEATRRKLMLD